MALPPYTPDADNALQPLDSVSGGYAAREIRAVKVKLNTVETAAATGISAAASAQATANTAVSNAAMAQGTADAAGALASDNADCIGVGGADDLGTFTGTTIPDTSTVKQALQALETYAEVLGTGALNNAYATLGTLVSDTDMGTFTGSLLPDSQSVKSLLQTIETRLEQAARIFNCTLNGTTGTPTGGVDGFTFNDMNYLLAAMPDDCVINVSVSDFAGTWSKVAGTVTKTGCTIHIDIVANGSPVPKGITITALDSSYITNFIDCEVRIKGVGLVTNTVLRLVAGASGISVTSFYAGNSTVNMDRLTVQFANSAVHAAGCDFALFYQPVGAARLNSITAEWDPVFTPVPNTNGIYVVKAGTTGESWADHDLDISYFELAAATATYYKGATNRKYISDVFNSASPAPHTLAANSKLTFDLATSGRVMQRITSGMLILTCTSTDQGYAVGEILYLAIGAPGSSVASDMGAFISADLAGTQQIATITLTIGQGGLSYVRDTAAYIVVALNLAKWDGQLYCRDES